jgi:hypothetical protein
LIFLIFKIIENGDRYEGMWYNDKKEGPGKFVYRQKRQILEGEWADGLPRCGTLKDLPPIAGSISKKFLIPQVFQFTLDLDNDML